MAESKKSEDVKVEFIARVSENQQKTKDSLKDGFGGLFLEIDNTIKELSKINAYIDEIVQLRMELDAKSEVLRLIKERKKKKKKKKKATEEEKEEETTDSSEKEEEKEGEVAKKKESKLKLAIKRYKENLAKAIAISKKNIHDMTIGQLNSYRVWLAAKEGDENESLSKRMMKARLGYFAEKIDVQTAKAAEVDIKNSLIGYKDWFLKTKEIIDDRKFSYFYDLGYVSELKFIDFYKEIEKESKNPETVMINKLGKEGLIVIKNGLNSIYFEFDKKIMELYNKFLDRHLLLLIKKYKIAHGRCIYNLDKLTVIVQNNGMFLKSEARRAVEEINKILG